MREHLLRPSVFDAVPEVRCAISTRNGGVSPAPLGLNLGYGTGDDPSNVAENRRRFLRALDITEDRLVTPRQCHSARVVVTGSPGAVDAADGLVTGRPQLWLAVTVADCVPVFLYDRRKKAVAAIHAGWRGTAAKIAVHGMHVLKEEFSSSPRDLLAFIGPSAGPCCYEVKGDVAEQFQNGTLVKRAHAFFLDLKTELEHQLLEEGVAPENIEKSRLCTICNPDLFHSYRRDGKNSGRMMGIIGMIRN